MKSKTAFTIVLAALLLVMTFTALHIPLAKADWPNPTPVFNLPFLPSNPTSQPMVSINQSTITWDTNQNVSVCVNVSVSTGELDLFGWQMNVTWMPSPDVGCSLLNIVAFHGLSWVVNYGSIINNKTGQLMCGQTCISRSFNLPVTPANSPLTLFTVTFQGTTSGSCALNLINVELFGVSDDGNCWPSGQDYNGVPENTSYAQWPDVNKDGAIDIYDAILVANHWGQAAGSSPGAALCDFNEDGVVDTFDGAILGADFGKVSPNNGLTNTVYEFSCAVQVGSGAAGPPFHDAAITDVETSQFAYEGDNATISVEAFNDGSYPENFSVSAYANITGTGYEILIGTQNVSLASWYFTDLSFTWDTTGVSEGSYTISAFASYVTGEADLANNLYVGGEIGILSPFHDVAITDVEISSQFAYEGDNVTVSVEAFNEGCFAETFNVTAYANNTVTGDNITIGTQSVSLARWDSYDLSFTWDTTGVSEGSYTISAFASYVTGEADLANNLYVGGEIGIFPLVPFNSNEINVTCPTTLTMNPSIFTYDSTLQARLVYIGNATIQSTGFDGILTAIGSTNGTIYLCLNQPGVDVYDFYLPLNGTVQVPLWLMFQPGGGTGQHAWGEYNGNFTLQLTVGGNYTVQLEIIGIGITVCSNGAYGVDNETVSFTWNLTGGSPVYLEAETNLPPGWSYSVDPPIGTLFWTPQIVTVNITAPPDAKEGDMGSVTLRAYENSTGVMIWQFIYFATTNNELPTIENVQPPTLTPTGNLMFNTTVKDASGIGNVQLYYSVNNGTWNNESMGWNSGDTFNSTSYTLAIPRVPDNSTIQYYVVATDWLGNQTQSAVQTATVKYDVAITQVATSKAVVGQGFTALINVTAANQGTLPTTSLKIFFYANTTRINIQTVPFLTNGTATALTFLWNTTGLAYGNYTLNVCAEPLPGETNTTNNIMTGGTVYVGIPGDINGDGTVDIYDAILLSGAFNSSPGSATWSPNVDINCDGIVDIYDAIILSGYFN